MLDFLTVAFFVVSVILQFGTLLLWIRVVIDGKRIRDDIEATNPGRPTPADEERLAANKREGIRVGSMLAGTVLTMGAAVVLLVIDMG